MSRAIIEAQARVRAELDALEARSNAYLGLFLKVYLSILAIAVVWGLS